MTTATLRRSPWGMSTPRDDRPWYERALCAGRPEWTDTEALSRPAVGPTLLALRLGHACTNHCPVLAQCQADIADRKPAGVVQAGVLWKDKHQRPVVLRDPGCGTWCGRKQ